MSGAIKEFYYDKRKRLMHRNFADEVVMETFFNVSHLEANSDRSVNAIVVIFDDIWGLEKTLSLDRGTLANKDLTMKLLYTEGMPYCEQPELLIKFLLSIKNDPA